MRILNVVHQYLPQHAGGTEQYTKSLAQEISGRGHQVTIFYRHSAPGAGIQDRIDQEIRIRAAWAGEVTPVSRFLSTFREPHLLQSCAELLFDATPDLVHFQHLMGLPIALLDLVRKQGIPYIITLHDYWWICANAQLLTNYSNAICSGPRAFVNCTRCAVHRSNRRYTWLASPALVGLMALRNQVLRRGLRTASTLVAPTDFVRNWYVNKGIPATKIETIPHGIEPVSVQAQPTSPQERPPRFAYAGGVSHQKGVHILLEAFSQVQGEAELWIIGDESFDRDYTALLHSLATPQVRFIGKLERGDVYATLAQVDAVLIPSLWYETFSLIAHEAFAVGVPVLCSRLGALAEIVQDNVDGFLIPPGDVVSWRSKLQLLIDRPEILTQMRANIKPPMTLREHGTKLETLYAATLKRSD